MTKEIIATDYLGNHYQIDGYRKPPKHWWHGLTDDELEQQLIYVPFGKSVRKVRFQDLINARKRLDLNAKRFGNL